MSGDWIEIRGLEVRARIGITEAERAEPQRLLLDVRFEPLRSFANMPDEIAATVDYAAVAGRLKALAAERSHKLIEILADEAATAVLREFAVRRVQVTVRKFILPDTEHVAVRCERQRNH